LENIFSSQQKKYFDSKKFEGLDSLWELYGALEAESTHGAKALQIGCPKACAQCCFVPQEQIEASVFEMLPLALKAWQEDFAQDLFSKAEKGDLHCLLILPGEAREPGLCSFYEFRPLMCRLFGFSRYTNSKNEVQLYACDILHRQEKLNRIEIPGTLESRIALPELKKYRQELEALNPQYAGRLQSINEALLEALQVVGLPFRFKSGPSRRRKAA